MANMDALFFGGLFLYIFLKFVVVGCLGHDFLDGFIKSPYILGRHFLDVTFQ